MQNFLKRFHWLKLEVFVLEICNLLNRSISSFFRSNPKVLGKITVLPARWTWYLGVLFSFKLNFITSSLAGDSKTYETIFPIPKKPTKSNKLIVLILAKIGFGKKSFPSRMVNDKLLLSFIFFKSRTYHDPKNQFLRILGTFSCTFHCWKFLPITFL